MRVNLSFLFQLSLCVACLMVCHRPVVGQAAENKWQVLETRYSYIRYTSFDNLTQFNDKINYGPNQWSLKRLFSPADSDTLVDIVRKKVDMIYERVQEILDMRKKIKKVVINVYPDQKALHDSYRTIYGQPCNLRAWYIYEYHTIYLNVEDMHEGMLAHEMAHGVIDHFLSVRPPRATAEILARYVDSHLK